MNQLPTQRANAMQASFDFAEEDFKTEYLGVLMAFIRSGQEFIGEAVQDEYKRRGLPAPTNWRAVGAIYQRLLREGVIEAVGYGRRNQGNPSPKYRGKVK